MKFNFIKSLLIIVCLSTGYGAFAQQSKSTSSGIVSLPESFTISKKELSDLLGKQEKTTVRTRNKYLNHAVVVKNVSNGDMRFLRLQLMSIKTGFLTIQVNGTHSTQVFVLSGNKSVFYKGRMEKGSVILTKCEEDEIVSE